MQEHCISFVNESFDINYDVLKNYIGEKTNGEKFCIVLLIGGSQLGKTTFAQSLSGIEHTIGMDKNGKTTAKGATIAYCGRMCEITKRKSLNLDSNDRTHVFVIDTDALTSNLDQKDKLIQCVLHLVSVTSTLVFFQPNFVDTSNVCLLEFINSHFPEKGNLIVNVAKEIDIEEEMDLKETTISKKLLEKGISHEIVIQKDVLSKVVEISNEIKFDDTEVFIENLKQNQI